MPSDTPDPGAIAAAVRILQDARKLAVLTGAGMSQESGVPTFRDELTGLWATFNPTELATESAFRRNPARVFSWYVTRLSRVRDVTPHEGYLSLVTMERHFDRVVVITQNVDGLHTRSGSRHVLEIHGSLERFRCLDAGHPYDRDVLELADGEEMDDGEMFEPPLCTECGSPVRPGVVWFGEMLPESEVELAWQAAADADAMLVVGTSAEVFPAADLPRITAASGAKVIEINPSVTPISSYADVCCRGTAARALTAISVELEHQLSLG